MVTFLRLPHLLNSPAKDLITPNEEAASVGFSVSAYQTHQERNQKVNLKNI